MRCGCTGYPQDPKCHSEGRCSVPTPRDPESMPRHRAISWHLLEKSTSKQGHRRAGGRLRSSNEGNTLQDRETRCVITPFPN